MIITKTPFRMSFFGGGTDIEEFFKKNGGAVLSSTIDKYCFVTVRHLPPFFNFENEICYHKIERTANADEIEHPLIKNAMKMLDIQQVRIAYEADLPARSGLGTSSSFAVGLLNALHTIKKENTTKKQLADEAIYLERTLCQEKGGWQDQIAASFGGFNRIDFDENGYKVTYINLSNNRKNELNDNLMLCFTGKTRMSCEIQNSLHADTFDKLYYLKLMKELVNQGQKILEDENENLEHFGYLLDKEWELKKMTNAKATTNEIDELYIKAKACGAIGGKILGAGGGGFILLYASKEVQKKILDQISNILYVPFKFDDSGSLIIFNNREKYMRNERSIYLWQQNFKVFFFFIS